MRYLRACIVVIFLTPFSSLAGKLMFPIPSGAIKADHVVIQPSVAEQDYFWMKAAYPSQATFDHYNRVFAKWSTCASNIEGWDSFGDMARQKPSFVHRNVKHWVSLNNDRAVTVMLEYRSDGIANRIVPDNDNQFVVVLQHRVSDAKAFLKETGVECAIAPNSMFDADALAARKST